MTSIAIREPHNTNQIIISDITIHQDSHGRYSLNDLHTASGGEQKNKPVHWLDTQHTNDLIEEISKVGFSTFEPVFIKKGRYGGTYVCKELVYSYAMWISAAFALKVIRAYDALVTGQIEAKPRKQPKQIAGRITPDQQEAIKQLVLNRGKALPKESQAKAMITMWSALKTHFGCTYKEIESEQFTEALSLAARVPLEGELLSKEELPAPVAQQQISDSDLQTLCWLWQHSVDMANYMMDIEPLLQLAEHRLAGAYATHPQIAIKCANSARQILEKASEHIQIKAIQMDNWMVLHNLRKPNYPF
ncbi:KilA-N domain-containing protein [Xenorhabdus ishibashii]|uniref:Antirepressor n=1 Tax=Xenorhabdus ishibashii TaxID=1034471 RepID=A0A2D0KCJ6_9GAMM|nr:KilA-N domain-containing protein [Xenorhabdus ishibashii]PHM61174.1 antirepressor [Xenorhabdus ishibashii]